MNKKYPNNLRGAEEHKTKYAPLKFKQSENDFKVQQVAQFEADNRKAKTLFKETADSYDKNFRSRSNSTKRIMLKEDATICPDNTMHYFCTEYKELKDAWIIMEAYKLMKELAENGETAIIPPEFGAVLFITGYSLVFVTGVRQNVTDYHKDIQPYNMHPVSVHFTLQGEDAKFSNAKRTWASKVGQGSVLIVQHVPFQENNIGKREAPWKTTRLEDSTLNDTRKIIASVYWVPREKENIFKAHYEGHGVRQKYTDNLCVAWEKKRGEWQYSEIHRATQGPRMHLRLGVDYDIETAGLDEKHFENVLRLKRENEEAETVTTTAMNVATATVTTTAMNVATTTATKTTAATVTATATVTTTAMNVATTTATKTATVTTTATTTAMNAATAVNKATTTAKLTVTTTTSPTTSPTTTPVTPTTLPSVGATPTNESEPDDTATYWVPTETSDVRVEHKRREV